MHQYYTPKAFCFQAFLNSFAIFVNYAEFYVNAVMLTAATNWTRYLIIRSTPATSSASIVDLTLNVDFEGNLASFDLRVNSIYAIVKFVQVNENGIF